MFFVICMKVLHAFSNLMYYIIIYLYVTYCLQINIVGIIPRHQLLKRFPLFVPTSFGV